VRRIGWESLLCAWLVIAACGRTTDDGDKLETGANGGAGTAEFAGSSDGGARLDVGGAFANGGALTGGDTPPAGGASNWEDLAGAAGESDDENTDYSRARWPMPNAAGSGLPNEVSYDTSHPGVVRDRVTGLVWQRQVGAVGLVWEDAARYCAELSLDGQSDWRMPSRIELASLFASGTSDETRAPFPGAENPVAGNWFWSASPFEPDASRVWAVDPWGLMIINLDQQLPTVALRCVRTSGVPRPRPTVHVVNADTVQDTATGLSWERRISFSMGTVDAATDHCASLTLAGHDDWRLPSIQELVSVVDEHRAAPAVDPSEFPDDPALLKAWLWSSADRMLTIDDSSGRATSFADGTVYAQSRRASGTGSRCVR